MKNYLKFFLQKIARGDKIKVNKRISAILVCLFIATICWFLIALSKEYSSSLKFPVVYNNLPGQKVVVNDLPATILLNVKASGFKILSFKFRKEQAPVQIDVDARMGQKFSHSDEMAVIPTSTFLADFNTQLGTGISIEKFYPDSIVFNFSFKSFKRVPVHADLKISFDRQYDSIGHAQILPDSVAISGPASLVANTNFISTMPILMELIKEPIVRKVRLTADKMLSLSDTMVKVILPVEKFTEENIEIPIIPVHTPNGYLLKTFPNKVSVRYQVPLSKYNLVNAALFGAVVDAGNLNDAKVNKMNVELIAAPSFIRSITIEPSKVDYILRKQ